MNRLRFNDLPQPVRERIIQIGRAPTQDQRVLSFTKSFSAIWPAYVVGVLALFSLVPTLQQIIVRGQVADPYYDRQTYYGLAAAIGAIVVCFTAIVMRFIWKPPPYPEGIYVFCSYLMKTRGGELDLMSLADIGTPTVVTVRRNGSYQHTRLELGGPFTIHYNSDANARTAWERIASARGRWRTMLTNRDSAAIAQADPFFECTTSGGWQYPQPQPAPPLADTRPRWTWAMQWGAAALIGMAMSGLMYVAIDNIFDDDRTAYANRFKTTKPAPPRGSKSR